jgi:hypothetical protein
LICVIYLLFNDFESDFYLKDEEFEALLRLNIHYNYTARNWCHHTRAALAEVEQLIMDLFENEAKVSSSSQALIAFKLHSTDFSYFKECQGAPCSIFRIPGSDGSLTQEWTSSKSQG